MRIEQLEYVVELSKNTSINQASKKLFISQQSLSESLNHLEAELGFSIFIRTKNGVKLTPTGKKFVNEAQEILDIYHGWSKFRDKKNIFCTDISIYAMTFFYDMISDIIIKSKQSHPNIQINIQRCNVESSLNDILKQNVNFILYIDSNLFSNTKFFAKEINEFLALSTQWVSQKIYSSPAFLLVSSKNPLVEKYEQKELSINDLYDETIIFKSDSYKIFYENRLNFSDKTLILPDKNSIIRAVLQNKGVYFFINNPTDKTYLQFDKLKLIPTDFINDYYVDFFIMHKVEKKMSPAERFILNSIIEYFNTELNKDI